MLHERGNEGLFNIEVLRQIYSPNIKTFFGFIKMMNYFRVLLAALTLFIDLTAIAAPDSTKQNQNLSASSSLQVANNELILAKAELAASLRFQDQVLTTVYWSLGTIAGLAILLVGYGWWSNFRIYDRDKQSLERELMVLLDKETNELKEQLRVDMVKKISDASASLDKDLKTAEERVSKSFETLLESNYNKTRAQLSQLTKKQEGILEKIYEIELAKTINERQEAIDKRMYRNALQDSVSALEIALKLSFEYRVGEVLDLVTEDINNALTSKEIPIDNYLIGQLVGVLDKVQGDHAHAAAGLKSKVPALISQNA